MDQQEVDLILEFVQEMYVGSIEGVDWNRVCIEATARCFRLQEKDTKHPKGGDYAEFCPECLRLQLLTYEKDREMTADEIDQPEGIRPQFLSEELTKAFADWLVARKKEADDGN